MPIRQDKTTPHMLKCRAYYLENKKRACERAKIWAKNNPERVKVNSYKSRKRFEGTPKHIFHVLKRNSVKTGRIFNLNQEDFLDWYLNTSKKCEYCGLDESLVSKWCPSFKRLSIDRINNDIPYIVGNMTLACPTCNQVKGNKLSFLEMKFVGSNVIAKRYSCA